jgi:hypothetical protein
MSKITEFISRWVPAAIFTLILAANVTIAALGGCGKLVKVEMPEEVQALLPHVGDKVALVDVAFVFDELELKVRHAAIKLQDNTDDALAFYYFLQDSGLLFASIGANAAEKAGFPAAGSLLLAGFAFMTDRPGTKRRLKSAQQRGYEKGKNGDAAP